jgi:hypothetical protein
MSKSISISEGNSDAKNISESRRTTDFETRGRFMIFHLGFRQAFITDGITLHLLLFLLEKRAAINFQHEHVEESWFSNP